MLIRSVAVCTLIHCLGACGGVVPDTNGVIDTVSQGGVPNPSGDTPAGGDTGSTPGGGTPGGGGDSGGGGGSPAPANAKGHHRCGWMFSIEPAAATAFISNAAWYDAIHPVWFALQSDSVSVRTLADVDNAAVLSAARANHVAIIPLVASVENTQWTRTMMADPAKRAAHIRTLVELATRHGYDGLDLDYEHLWNDADAAPLAAFVTEVGAAMHAAGKSISMAVPALDGPSKVWSYSVLGNALDRVHLMAYDFHTLGSPHAGPTSPLGWIDAVGTQVQAAGHTDRFLLGLPNYGVGTNATCQLGQCASTCTGPISDGSGEMANCPLNEKHHAAGKVSRCETANGTIYFDDPQSLADKARSAIKHGMAGIGYWNLGGEPIGFYEALKSAVP